MKETLLVGGIIVALTGVFGYHNVYGPQEAKRSQILKRFQEEQANQRAGTGVAAAFQEIERYRERLSPVKDTSWLLGEVVKIADASGVQLTTITPDVPGPVGPFTRLGVNLQFTASYHHLGAFLDRVEHAAPFIRVDSVDIDQASDSGRHGRHEVSIHAMLSTLYVPAPLTLTADLPAAPGAVPGSPERAGAFHAP